MSRPTTTIHAVVAAIAVAAIAWPAGASAFPAPLPAKVTARGHSVNAAIGSYCVDATSGNAGMCVDEIFAEPGRRHRLSVAPGIGMTFEFRNSPLLNDDVASVSGSLFRFNEDGRATNVGSLEISAPGDAGDVWSAQLPKKLHRANAVGVFTGLEGGGDISYLVGLDSSRRQPLRCPGEVGVPVRAREIRGLDVEAAQAFAEQRGCQLRVVRIDGVPQAVTEDLSYSRVNVIVRNGLVVGIDGIY